jgi:hypothetical protein
LLTGENFRREIGTNHINTIQGLFFLDIGLLALIREVVFLDMNSKVLTHFVVVQHFAHAQANVLLAAQGALVTARGRGHLLQFLFRGGQQFGRLRARSSASRGL